MSGAIQALRAALGKRSSRRGMTTLAWQLLVGAAGESWAHDPAREGGRPRSSRRLAIGATAGCQPALRLPSESLSRGAQGWFIAPADSRL